jgi:hypothetical protein
MPIRIATAMITLATIKFTISPSNPVVNPRRSSSNIKVAFVAVVFKVELLRVVELLAADAGESNNRKKKAAENAIILGRLCANAFSTHAFLLILLTPLVPQSRKAAPPPDWWAQHCMTLSVAKWLMAVYVF